jgi:hypothetical protein
MPALAAVGGLDGGAWLGARARLRAGSLGFCGRFPEGSGAPVEAAEAGCGGGTGPGGAPADATGVVELGARRAGGVGCPRSPLSKSTTRTPSPATEAANRPHLPR